MSLRYFSGGVLFWYHDEVLKSRVRMRIQKGRVRIRDIIDGELKGLVKSGRHVHVAAVTDILIIFRKASQLSKYTITNTTMICACELDPFECACALDFSIYATTGIN